ncbi:putative domain HDIG-containing protein [Sphaerochaeta pleomorpha str. Grapes]|uniref:Putative domain HDIG-containing protein n=1 Tax=Sphaerochaeta pleomorpha (strain ATCC BAA-1885 / DSM 22778 / Grapes) TaxID=158190 RepID=G8QWQ0_SPHPG|nr:CCA tRNA nucleotidyltransferase [Sphaerochaeta pleomorpha]AEV28344.1 putative domain HDIG-containing protein [Sphaerochaeta pleomorpha str. Grapes]
MQKFPVSSSIKRFASRFKDAGFSLYIVGGAIRDYLLGIENDDFDFTTDAEPTEVISLFHHVIPTGIAHGTVTVIFEKQKFEVTTFRSDGSYVDGRHPESVTFIRNLEEDLKRRDFTINAFAADCSTGEIIDLHDGRKDLKNQCIRAIGDPQLRFKEDALRIFRGCRLASKLNFSIEKETLEAMRDLKDNLLLVSMERIRDELFKMVESNQPIIGLTYLKQTSILTLLFPALAKGEGIEQGGMHHQDILSHNFSSCQAAADMHFPLEVRLAALFHDIGKSTTIANKNGVNTFYQHEIVGQKETKKIMSHLKASNEQINTVSLLVREHMFSYKEDWTDSAVRRFINRVGLAYIPLLFQLRLADQKAIHDSIDITMVSELDGRIQKILSAHDALSIRDLAINGNDLMQAGIPKGPRIGQLLNLLLETVLDDPKQNKKEQLLAIAESYQSELGTTTLS